MIFRLIPKSVILNDLERSRLAVTLRYFTEFGKHAFQHITATICAELHESIVFYSTLVTMSS